MANETGTSAGGYFAVPGHLALRGRPIAASAGLLLFGLMAARLAAAASSGHVDVGVREVDVDGDEAKYEQQVNLDSGPRLFGLGFSFEPAPGTGNAPDRVSLQASGLGGDPYQNIRAEIRKYGAYRFTYERDQSDYVYHDLLIDPADADVEASTGGDFRSFDFRRTRDRAAFEMRLTDRACFNLGFDRYEKDGESTTPIDVEREEFELDAPVEEILESFDLGFAYDWDRMTISLNQRWREFDNDTSAFLPGASEGSEPGEPTRLDYYFLDQPYGYDSSESRVGLIIRPAARWQVKADLFYADLEMDFDARERSQGSDWQDIDFTRDLAGTGGADRETLQLFVAASYAITDRIRLTASVRDQSLDQDADMSFDSVPGISDWQIDTTGVALGAEAMLGNGWTVSGGWTGESRETRYEAAMNGFAAGEEVETDRDGFYAMVSYRPGTRWNLSFSAEDNGIDDPFTLASPTDSRRYRLRGAYRWDNGVNLSASWTERKNDNDNSGWESESSHADVRLGYSSDAISASVGASFTDMERSIDQEVSGGFRQDLFLIRYDADSSFVDGMFAWQAAEWLDLSASFRDYDNDGSFEVARQDYRLAAGFSLPDGYGLGLSWRRVDFEEGGLEEFDADIWEASLTYRW